MTAIGVALLYASYTAGLYGYCLIKGYNVSFKMLFTGDWPPPTAGSTLGNAVGGAVQQVVPQTVTPAPGVNGKSTGTVAV
jgi:hypothetical protein